MLLTVYIEIENTGINLNVGWLDTGQIYGEHIHWDNMHHEKKKKRQL